MTDTVIKGDNLRAMFGVNRQDAEEGKWFKIGNFAEIKIRRFNSKHSTKVRERLMAQHAPATVPGVEVKLHEAVEEQINIEHVAVGLIADWRGITDVEGRGLPYTRENAVQLLKDLPDLVSVIAEFSVRLKYWTEKDEEETKGN